ncbi:MAG: 3-phosphoshikimate 1-carboxyvinyltransferase [Planctomycetaceae bacterium]|jgi:3-phosphoshikimate 1-carboxyvinyltransferase|nr:3-phosphoshikimate 1-carboxyvinyltransferase [Planctomycetaceae bacterium]
MNSQKIRLSHPIQCTVFPPGSKSVTNRALICAALSNGATQLNNALDSEDTQVMLEALRMLELSVQHDKKQSTMTVTGHGGTFPNASAEIYVGNSGTTARFLTATLAAAQNCRYRIYGKPRMHERPIGDLLAALKQLGADVQSETKNNCPPVLIGGQGTFGGSATVNGNISSQFLSALLLAAPISDSGVVLQVNGDLVSKPYIQMTLEVMRAFGVYVNAAEDFSRFTVNGHYNIPAGQLFEYDIEPDASAASYFFSAAAITRGSATVPNLTEKSLQGDIDFCRLLEQMGCRVKFDSASTTVIGGETLCGITADMNAVSDTVMTLGVTALFAKGTTRITNVAHIRHKETDRITALAKELRKFGAAVEEWEDGLAITPPSAFPEGKIAIDTYDDHRMAMSFAIAGLNIPNVEINDANCVAKTYPKFFDDLDAIIVPKSIPIANSVFIPKGTTGDA